MKLTTFIVSSILVCILESVDVFIDGRNNFAIRIFNTYSISIEVDSGRISSERRKIHAKKHINLGLFSPEINKNLVKEF